MWKYPLSKKSEIGVSKFLEEAIPLTNNIDNDQYDMIRYS